MSKILHLKAQNVQRIKVAEITPDGNVVVVGGNNGQGKTSLLDSIMFALGGKKALSDKPVREGADKGSVRLETEDFVATRTIFPDGKSELEFRPTKEGAHSSPQKFFDGIVSKLTFDPLAFAHMEKKPQVDVIKSLIPFNFSGNETFRKTCYDERTYVGREQRQKEAENEANPFDPELGIDEESPNAIMELIAEGSQIIAAKTSLKDNIARGKAKLEELKAEAEKIEKWLLSNEPKLAELEALSIEDHSAKLEELQRKNERIRKNAEAKRIYTAALQHKAKYEELTKTIDRLDKEKMDAIEAAQLPVGGLSFDEDTGVTFGGIPFAQLSGAERLKVSLAIGIALNPSLRVLLIRDGSLLDAENLKVVTEMATQHDMQVWLERVGKGEECSVIMEDGLVEKVVSKQTNGEQHAH